MRPRTWALIGVLVIQGTLAPARPLDVRVYPDIVYAINGVDRIQSAVFGVTAYEGAPWPAQPGWREAIARSGIACLGFPESGMSTPGAAPTNAAEVMAWYDSDAALADITEGNLDGVPQA